MLNMTLGDQAIVAFDRALKSVIPGSMTAARPIPKSANSSQLSIEQSRHAAGLMRVNHSGEVCAQALYHGQALTAKSTAVAHAMAQAASEEQDHLVWCEDRLRELNDHPSLLNPLWYGMSFMIGAAAGLAGDAYSLGFVAETEKQVSSHLQTHLAQLPETDHASLAIVQQMHLDEEEHRQQAITSGAKTLPIWVQQGMRLTAKIMTSLSYRI